MRHVHLHITGTVQGVFFRATAQEKAQELGIVGSIRNASDGSVFVDAQGHDDALEAFVAWCRHGPDAAVVENVTIKHVPVEPLSEFRIER